MRQTLRLLFRQQLPVFLHMLMFNQPVQLHNVTINDVSRIKVVPI